MNHEPTNIASFLPRAAATWPHRAAIFAPCGRQPDGRTRYVHLTFRQLDQESRRVAAGLGALGLVGRGTPVGLMVRPGLDLFVLTFALFRAGAVPVLLDPGIGLANIRRCLNEAGPEVFIGIPAAHAARVLFGWARRSIRRTVTVGRRWCWGGATLPQVRAAGDQAPPFVDAATTADETAAILFTSGSTGVPKGVVYSHANFVAQVALLQEAFGATPDEVDLPTFPLFALFNPALGLSTVIPDMDPTRPARVDPRRILEAIDDFGVTQLFGSPALLNTVGRYCADRAITLPTVRRVLSAGAPVAPPILERFAGLLTGGAQVHTPYGATEALPVTTVGSDELAATRARTAAGGGVCVGRPLQANTVHVIPIDDGVIPAWRDDLPLPPGEVGEIVVRGPTATRAYHRREEATRLAKIPCADGGFFHRMGDLGAYDEQGRLWFYGRKSQRVVTRSGPLFTVACEAVFNTHPAVFRTALVGVPRGDDVEPVICVELEPGQNPSEFPRIRQALLELAGQHDHTRAIRTFLLHPAFPVDIRHNAKIGREQLSRWAQEQTR